MSRPDRYSPEPVRGRYPPSLSEDRQSRTQQSHFDAPPRTAYDGFNAPRDAYDDDRPYAPADPRAHSFNQLTPYIDDKAEAAWSQSWEERQAYTHRPPPPPSDYDLGRKPRPSAGGRYRDYRYDDRSDDDGYHDDRYDEKKYHDDRNRGSHNRDRRRRSTQEELKEKALGYPSDPKNGGRDSLGGSEGERGIAAKLIGGAGGALLGQTYGRGHTLETIAGAAVGAIAASAIEKQIEKRKEGKVIAKSGRDGYVVKAVGPYPRDMRDVRESARDDTRPGLKARIRSLSRRGARSLSRRRPTDDRRRRSESYDSYDSFRRGSSR